MSKRTAAKLAAKKPLTGETKALAPTINDQVAGDRAVSIGSPQVYAATQQFGAKSGEFGLGLFKTRGQLSPSLGRHPCPGRSWGRRRTTRPTSSSWWAATAGGVRSFMRKLTLLFSRAIYEAPLLLSLQMLKDAGNTMA